MCLIYRNLVKKLEKKLFILLSTKQQQELKQFIMDIECGKIRLADILSCPFGSHVICCMNKNAGKAKFEIEKDDLFFLFGTASCYDPK